MKGTVLIILKDALTRSSLFWEMERGGWQVLLANNRADALQVVRERNVDVVLLGLPGFKEESLHILQAIKEAKPLTEIILLTGPRQISLAIQGMKLGAFDDILVPFDLESLISQVHGARDRKRRKERRRDSILNRLQTLVEEAERADGAQEGRQPNDKSGNGTDTGSK